MLETIREYALERLAEGGEAALALNNIGAVALALSNLGRSAHGQGDYGRAGVLYEESLALIREVGDKRDSALVLHRMGDTAQEQGEVQRALALYRHSLALYQEVGDKVGMVACLEGVARVACAQGRRERAARLGGAAEGLRAALLAPLVPADRVRYGCMVESVRAALGDEAFAMAWAAGRAGTLDQALAEALEEPITW